MADIEDLITFLKPNQRDDIKKGALVILTQLTGTQDGLKMIFAENRLIQGVLLLIHNEDGDIAKDALKILINLSAEKNGSDVLLIEELQIVSKMIDCINNPEYSYADLCCAILGNLSRDPQSCKKVLQHVDSTDSKLEGLIFTFCQIDFNKKGSNLHLLAPVITNFSQIHEGRTKLLNKEKCSFQRLLPFTQYSSSKERRKSIIGAIHNCCFEKDYHEWLLSDDIDICSHLCLPLAGPDVYTLEENESLPLDLQFLPDDKTRESDIEVRSLLLESIMQLCISSVNRKRLRDLNIYLVMREYHKWEENEACTAIVEDIVNLLIRTEDEIGEEDLSTMQIPSDVEEKFTDFNGTLALEEPERTVFIK